jgi:hypothetical protein
MEKLSQRKRKFLEFVFLSYIAMIIAVALIYIVAMLLYPGGNFVNDDDSFGYSLIYNGLCDMRELTAVNGESNPYSSLLLKIGTIGICLAMFLFFGTLWIFFQDKLSTKIMSWIASILGIAFGPLNLCIIFLHSTFEIHMVFDILAPLTLNIAVILYTIIYFLNPKLPKINQYSFLALSIFAVSYSILVGISSGVIGGDFEKIVHRLGSNVLHFLTITIFLIQAFAIYFHLKKSRV